MILTQIYEGTVEEIAEQLRGNHLTGKLKAIVRSAIAASASNGTGETLDTALAAFWKRRFRL